MEIQAWIRLGSTDMQLKTMPDDLASLAANNRRNFPLQSTSFRIKSAELTIFTSGLLETSKEKKD